MDELGLLIGFACLLAVLALGSPIAILVQGSRQRQLARRLDALEAAFRALAAGPASTASAPPPVLFRTSPPATSNLPGPVPEPPSQPTGTADRASPSPPPLPPRPSAGLPPPLPQAPPAIAPVSRPRSFEEALGTRWTVWVGGVALALGGIFLVRSAIEMGLFGPAARVVAGLLFGAALMGAGEWLRRREEAPSLPGLENANVPAILTAAGTSSAFAAVYAAYGLYGLIGPAVAFVALGLVSLVAMVASLLHGPALAALGLLAALASPLLVQSTEPSPLSLVLYLAFATGSAYGVSRLRLWRWLARAAAIGAWLWGFAFLVFGSGWYSGAGIHVLVQLALAILFLAVDPYRRTPADEQRIDPMVAGILIGLAFLAALAADVLNVGIGQQALATLVVLMLAGAAVTVPAAAPGLAAAALTATLTLLLWQAVGAGEPAAIVRDLPNSPKPEAEIAYLTMAVLLNAIVATAGFGRVALGSRLRIPPVAWYVGAATLGPLASLVATYWRITFFDRSVPFAIVAAMLALGFATVAGLFRRIDPDDTPGFRLALGVAASASVAALAAGLTFALDRGVLTIALALSALGAAIVAERARVPALRYVTGALGIAVAARLAWDPTVMRGEIGTTPILNWLLWGYGVPAAAFWGAARILSREGRDWVVRLVEALAILFGALLVFLEMRHALHAGDPFARTSDHLEAGLVVTEALGFTLLLARLDLRRPDPLYRWASLAFGALSLAGAALALGLRYNPLLSGEPILGGAIFNSLVPAYLLPAGLAAGIALSSRLSRPRWFVLSAAFLGLGLELTFACLEVRHLFQGDRIGFLRQTGNAEFWCYSLVLIGNGIGLLAIGFRFDSRIFRFASAICIVAAVVKVFLLDMAALEGITRALSFVGLGLTLVAIGLAYQRVLGARAPEPS